MREDILPYKEEEERMKVVEDDDKESISERIGGNGFSLQKRVVVVGYALTSKKTKSFLQPKLEKLAR